MLRPLRNTLLKCLTWDLILQAYTWTIMVAGSNILGGHSYTIEGLHMIDAYCLVSFLYSAVWRKTTKDTVILD